VEWLRKSIDDSLKRVMHYGLARYWCGPSVVFIMINESYGWKLFAIDPDVT
jgi:hypothetical protein